MQGEGGGRNIVLLPPCSTTRQAARHTRVHAPHSTPAHPKTPVTPPPPTHTHSHHTHKHTANKVPSVPVALLLDLLLQQRLWSHNLQCIAVEHDTVIATCNTQSQHSFTALKPGFDSDSLNPYTLTLGASTMSWKRCFGSSKRGSTLAGALKPRHTTKISADALRDA